MAGGQYWVTWSRSASNASTAKASALIWGPQANPPAQMADMFQAGPFATQADAQAYENQLGTGAILPGPGTPIVGSVSANSINPLNALTGIADFFHRLTEKETWTRVGEVALGGIIVYAALRGLTHGSATTGVGARANVTKPIRKVAKAGVTVAAPEVRYGARVAAKRVAPKTTARAAQHRTAVAKYGQKKPYRPPEPRQPAPPRVTYRYSEIKHVKG